MSATPTALIFLPKVHRLHFVKEVTPPIRATTFTNRAASMDTGAGRYTGGYGRTNSLESEGKQFSLAHGLTNGKNEGDTKKSLICVSCGTVNEIPPGEEKTEGRRPSRKTTLFIESIRRRSESERPSGENSASNIDSTHERQSSLISADSEYEVANDSKNRKVSFNDNKNSSSSTKEEATNDDGTHEKNVSNISGASASGQASVDAIQETNGDNVKETSNEEKKCEVVKETGNDDNV